MNDKVIFAMGFSGVWGIIGIIFFLIGIGMLNNRKKKEKECTSCTYGKVIDLARHQSYDSDGGYSSTWKPVFEYNVGELKYRKESLCGSTKSKFAIGQQVKIYYNPENNNEYYVEEETLPKTLGKIFTIIGIIAIVIALVSAILIFLQ